MRREPHSRFAKRRKKCTRCPITKMRMGLCARKIADTDFVVRFFSRRWLNILPLTYLNAKIVHVELVTLYVRIHCTYYDSLTLLYV